MIDDDDDYLWTGRGPVSLEVAGLERELRELRWRPREIEIGAASPAVEPDRDRRANEPADESRWWPPLVAGLLAAAAVLAVLLWLRSTSEDRHEPAPPEPSAQPSGSPPAGELVDPFGPDAPMFPPPVANPPELVDPFADDPKHPTRPPISPDLKDPFANSQPAPDPAPPRKHAPSPDLKDPFANSEPSPPREPGKLVDPFSGEQSPPPTSSPDSNRRSRGGEEGAQAPTTSAVEPSLKDPFRR